MRQAGDETAEHGPIENGKAQTAVKTALARFMRRTWKSSHLLIAAGVVFFLGAAIGNASQRAETDTAKSDLASARTDADTQKAAADKANSALRDATNQLTQRGAALDEANRRLAQTSTVPPTTTAPALVTTTTAAGPKTAFGNGQYRVGTDIAAGTYVAPGGSSCYWERQSTFGGAGSADIIANDLSSGGQVLVTISASDKGFKTSGCGTWTKG